MELCRAVVTGQVTIDGWKTARLCEADLNVATTLADRAIGHPRRLHDRSRS